MKTDSTCVFWWMKEEIAPELQKKAMIAVALLHYPVYDKNRQVVASAVTNLDLHDIARIAKTYGLVKYYVVTPLTEQKEIVNKVVRHWQEGWGASYNPARKAALDLMMVVDTLDAAVADMEKESGSPVMTIATGAKGKPNSISYEEMASLLRDENANYLLLLGTGWGLTEQVLSGANYVLAPLAGKGDYNHLSVRSAAAIIVDRLFAR
jgi:hypothetical protein